MPGTNLVFHCTHCGPSHAMVERRQRVKVSRFVGAECQCANAEALLAKSEFPGLAWRQEFLIQRVELERGHLESDGTASFFIPYEADIESEETISDEKWCASCAGNSSIPADVEEDEQHKEYLSDDWRVVCEGCGIPAPFDMVVDVPDGDRFVEADEVRFVLRAGEVS